MLVRLCLLSLLSIVLGAQAPCDRPLSGVDLKDLLVKRVTEAMVRQLITSCGLTMVLDEAAERELKRNGASDALVQLVREKATSPARSELELRAEIEHWASIKDSTTPAVFEDYLSRYPTGRFTVPARAKLAELTKATQPVLTPAPAATPTSVVPQISGAWPANAAPGQAWTNPQDNLIYRWIPPGTFTMGCLEKGCPPTEKPTVQARITQRFWMGQPAQGPGKDSLLGSRRIRGVGQAAGGRHLRDAVR